VLEVLLLNGNNIGEDGARHLVVALHVNKSLHYLGLQGSNLSGECMCVAREGLFSRLKV
jgi:hypothetical protein